MKKEKWNDIRIITNFITNKQTAVSEVPTVDSIHTLTKK